MEFERPLDIQPFRRGRYTLEMIILTPSMTPPHTGHFLPRGGSVAVGVTGSTGSAASSARQSAARSPRQRYRKLSVRHSPTARLELPPTPARTNLISANRVVGFRVRLVLSVRPSKMTKPVVHGLLGLS